LVELHQGKIWLNSELGKGSHFHFTLPVAEGRIATALENTVTAKIQAPLDFTPETPVKQSPVRKQLIF